MRSDGYLIGEADLLPLSLGAALLGTGGIGAPVVGVEKIEEGGECLRAMRAVEEASGKRFSAVISAEIGGANAMEPLIAAALAGIPAVDGDGMGRAFREVQMTTYMIYGADVAPAAIADEKGNVVVFRDIIDMYWLERFARDVAVGMGAGAGLAVAPMRGDFVRRTAIPGTVTKALSIGRTILEARAKRRNVVDEVCAATGARLCFTGKITDIERRLVGGFARGSAKLVGSGNWTGSEANIAIQNENLVLWVDGEPVVMVPDLIINLELDTGDGRLAALRPAAEGACLPLQSAMADGSGHRARRSALFWVRRGLCAIFRLRALIEQMLLSLSRLARHFSGSRPQDVLECSVKRLDLDEAVRPAILPERRRI